MWRGRKNVKREKEKMGRRSQRDTHTLIVGDWEEKKVLDSKIVGDFFESLEDDGFH